MKQMNISTKQKQTHKQRTDLWLPRGKRDKGGINWEFGVSRCKLLYREWVNNKVLVYSAGNYIQYPLINCNGKEFKKLGIEKKIKAVNEIFLFRDQILQCSVTEKPFSRV